MAKNAVLPIDLRPLQEAEKKPLSGVYKITPSTASTETFQVYCDMDETKNEGWTVCYNHYVAQNDESMDHTTYSRMSSIIGTPGADNEFSANCVKLASLLGKVKQVRTRFCVNSCKKWIEVVNTPSYFHDRFWGKRREWNRHYQNLAWRDLQPKVQLARLW